PEPDPPPLIFERREVGSLGSDNEAWDDVMLHYALAVRTMQQRNPAAETSWDYQAGIHGRASSEPQLDLFSTCAHAIWHFLDWHRGYLYQFEKIVRAAVVANGGPTDWALPFWDYSEAQGRALPWVFRQPTLPDGSPNPLRVEQRRADRNAGSPMSVIDTDHTVAFQTTVFAGDGLVEVGFGGMAPTLGRAFGDLENRPHNAIHVAINGWMGNPATAAQDPIFWVHHCNIDRLWEVWNRDGNANTGEAAWLSNTHQFYDETSTKVTMSTSGMQDIEGQLGYTYAGLAAPSGPAEPGFGLAPEEGEPAVPDDTPAEMVGATEEALTLAGDVATTSLQLTPTGPGHFGLDAGANEPQRVFLVVDNVTAEEAPSANYAVVLDMGDPSDRDDFTVGVLSFFGVAQASTDDSDRGAHGMRLSFEITDVVAELRRRDQWNEDDVRIRIEPTEPVEDDEPTEISVGRISIYYR
ncbi:MAG: tyrosinase family protein, partial [Acidimicrobiales bacterium]